MYAYTQCTRCHGRGYQPEKRKPSKRNPNALGFYARTCPKCSGSGYITTPVASQDAQDSPIVARVDELLSTPEDGTFWCKSERYPTLESYLAAGRPKRQ